MIKVFLVDDHEVMRAGLRAVLETEPDLRVVGETGRLHGAAELAASARPDVAVVDGRLQDGSGYDLVRELCQTDPPVPSIIYTTFREDSSVLAAVSSGARGFVLKDSCADDLVAAIRSVAQGHAAFDSAVTGRLMEFVRSGTEDPEGLGALNPQERRILGLIGRGMTNRQIAHQLGASEKTVKNNTSVVFHKLGLQRRTQAAVFAAAHLIDAEPAGDPADDD